MKVYSKWKKSVYLFNFFIADTIEPASDSDSKQALVTTSVLTVEGQEIWSGSIRVAFNEFGIFPVPEDLQAVKGPDSMKRMLLIELRRYIKPQWRFL
ncbi:hypothetical protein D0469_17455 [Peribacillus saganii]|uniref:Uncharacterized protein n=1 Tax=Peribacillus saganii TaxID=2303992 RepID=A0A372LJ37_9BACI|nr:hypothetical protein [Peribacillus saganii]RFU66417.1 hypothetical protein D0469_17455 [Peribacillus saganii]